MGFFSDLLSDNSSSGWVGMLSDGLDIYNSYTQASNQADALEANADTASKNAALETQRYFDALARGGQDAEDVATQGRRYRGKQQAAMGASGIVVDSGTFADVAEDTEAAIRRDTQTTLTNAYREAYGHKIAAGNASATASSMRDQADSIDTANVIGTAGSIYEATKRWWE